MTGKPRIAIIGAGGFVFPVRVIVDILSFPALRGAELLLHDIEQTRLERTEHQVRDIVARHNLPTAITATTDRRRALDGADYVIITFQVGGLEAYRLDLEIPRRFGVDQTVGDTLGPGGVFRGLRTAAVLMDISAELRALSPDALVIQYANPMAINCAVQRAAGTNVVGLCHSIQGTSRKVVRMMGYEPSDVAFRAGGINHLAWFTEFRHRGADVYPEIRTAMLDRYPPPDVVRVDGKPHASSDWIPVDKDAESDDLVRAETLRTFGYLHTEGSHHDSEYLPWFRKSPEITKAYLPRRWDYFELCLKHEDAAQQREKAAIGRGALDCSEEYAAPMIAALEGGKPTTIYGNVANRMPDGRLAITNLPADVTVEVACRVDTNGVTPLPFGSLPTQCAAVTLLNTNVQQLAVEAALTGEPAKVHQAIAIDPYSSAMLTLPEIRRMTDEMLEAQAQWLGAVATGRSA